jgi:hypothetical protein
MLRFVAPFVAPSIAISYKRARQCSTVAPCKGGEACPPGSATGNDFDDFEAIAGLKLAMGKFGRGDGFAVVFDDDAAG